ncbi:MAG TPA: biotin carboxylase N-terminal domain-containing protein [Rhizomicrobium sp.]|nr:biotin carboxylase N-terminal domain-containing protein [Rhizomicrobium sp.]
MKSVLVANRGEIALRILKTVKRLGMRGIVVHHALDADSPAVAFADAAIEITGATPVAAYLDDAAIIAAARRAGADAIHPGYGFLSENAAFARAVEAAGLLFIGPRPETIGLLGDKVRARAFVAKHGYPVAPSAVEDDDPPTFAERARALGAPLLVKPSAGGGGKGMRIVRDMALLAEELERARSEGLRYFGDGRLYVERYVERPRHIEVQVLGDAHGNVVHLFERECSMQRRFQKIVEEAPSPALDEAERTRICETAAGIARRAGYRNAGTVEFIYGGGAFYFLEMNTRLQVEHPVTEAITGLDLVEEQIRIAEGAPLRLAQEDLRRTGHAIELRIYAEDAGRGFVPTTGPVLMLKMPDDVRVDCGVREGQQVTAAFDPMLAKLVVHADTRDAAIDKARAALARVILLGCRINTAFLSRLIDTAEFRAGDLHTGLIAELPEIAADPAPDAGTLRTLLAVAARHTPAVVEAARRVPALHASIGEWRN